MLISLKETDHSFTIHSLLHAWFTDYAGELVTHLDRLIGDPACAEDLLQDTFVRAMNALTDAPPANPRAWLYRIATNLALNHLRHRSRWHRLFSLLRRPAATDDHVLVTHAIRRCLAALKPQDAEVLILIRYAGYSPTEVAALTGEPLTAIRKRLFRAGMRFRELHTKETAI